MAGSATLTSGQSQGVATGNRASRFIDRYNKLRADRYNWDQMWQEVLKHTVPHKAFITRSRIPSGQRVDTDLFDSTGRRANQTLAAGFHGNLTNPATRWFKLRVQDADLMAAQEVKSWMADTEDRMFDVINGSNFTQQIHQAYLDLGSVGTATLFEVEDSDDVVRFTSFPIEEMIIAEDHRGKIDTVFRRYELTIRQAWDKWGEDAGKTVKEGMNKRRFDEKLEFIHTVQPREARDINSSTAKNMPWASVHIALLDKHIVAEGGFNEMPFFVTRFAKVSGEPYGYSPGIIMLPDLKMLNAVTKTIIKAAQKIVDPPLVLPHDGFVLPLKTTPGGINYKLSGATASGERIGPIATGGNLPVGFEMQNQMREIINQGYFVDLFLVLQDKRNMTATEVAERIAEKMVMLGPTLGRLQTEMLNPIIERTFAIMLRRGLLLPTPEILADRDLVIDYISPLALAQKREKIQGLQSLLNLVGGMSQFAPNVIHKIDTDKAVDESADVFGVDPDIIRDDEAVAAIREQEAKAQQMQQMAALAGQAADLSKTAAEGEKANAEANAKNVEAGAGAPV